MLETFTALLLAHALADFVFQTNWIMARKREPLGLILHGLIVLATALALTGHLYTPHVLALAAAHMIIDLIKTFLFPKGLASFLADQAAHIATIAVLSSICPTLWATGLWATVPWLPAAFALAAGAIIAVRAGGFAVGLLMARWKQDHAIETPPGLPGGGELIGTLERALIFLLVITGQIGAIGFLIAAKSVLRFDTTSKDQAISEYVIVGTLASFGWALAVSFVTTAVLSHLPPLGFLGHAPYIAPTH